MNSKQGTKRRREHRCSNCKEIGHIRTNCLDLDGLGKYQKRGTDYYWNKKGELKWFCCVLGNRITNTGEMDFCWSESKCPECIQVRLMGLELKQLRFINDYEALPDHCRNCSDRSPLSEAEGHRNNTICQKKKTPKPKRNKKHRANGKKLRTHYRANTKNGIHLDDIGEHLEFGSINW